MVLAGYEERLAAGDVEIKDLVVSKRITREPRDYQKAGVTAIAAQQLFGSGVMLHPGQNIEYIITDSEPLVLADRVRAFALWEGWFGYDRKKYAVMLHEAFQPFELFLAEPPLHQDPRVIRAGEDWADTPLLSLLKLPHHPPSSHALFPRPVPSRATARPGVNIDKQFVKD